MLINSSYEKKDWIVIINNFININKNEQLPYFWFIHSHIKSFFTIISIVYSNLCSNLSMTQYHIICLNYCINYDKIRLKALQPSNYSMWSVNYIWAFIHPAFCTGGLLWSWSYSSWIYYYLCNQCLSPHEFKFPLMARCTWNNIMW